MKTIESFEAACLILKISEALPDVLHLPEQFQKGVIPEHKLAVIIQAYNGTWVADPTDTNQLKYFPVFWVDDTPGQPAGSGFRFYFVGGTIACTHVGPRLQMKSEAIAKQMAKDHLELYKEYYLRLK